MKNGVRNVQVATYNGARTVNRFSHGLRTPNEGINQRNLKIWADVADCRSNLNFLTRYLMSVSNVDKLRVIET